MLRNGHETHRVGTRLDRLEASLALSLTALTPRQRAFYDHWWAEAEKLWPRAYRSAEAAGYACPRSQGPRLLTMPRVRAAMDARIALERGLAQHERRSDRLSIRAYCRDYVTNALATRLYR
ncbi:hypothetical protein [Singulisphaera sp. PoT]|uniref:hypothetical protein n=1 Tax=Singulisphaera sp. PoT TaxID=3411797 RepID=UPI003BF4963E